MTGEELKSELAELGITRAHLVRMLEIGSENTVYRWSDRVPAAVEGYVRVLGQLTKARLRAELKRGRRQSRP